MSKSPDQKTPTGAYAGDVTARQAWSVLGADPKAVLVDVRTQIEWTLIGKPDLSGISREPVYLQWVTMQGPNPNFVDELQAALEVRKVPKDAPVYFLCQSGGRSKIAAIQCAGLGYTACYNIAEGFEGDLDGQGRRGRSNGWRSRGLPWGQD